jgi:hypothetical protein
MVAAMAIFANAFNSEKFSGFLGARQGVFGPFGLILILDPPWGWACLS